jgi:DNA-binding NarL/FixJ family response regulator
LAVRISAVRPVPAAAAVPRPEPWLSALASTGDQRLSRVAALGLAAQAKLRLGHARECLDALNQQRAAAGTDQAALVWALTMSAVCRAVLGGLSQARADLAAARRVCQNSAPLLAEPFWRFAGIVCDWLAGDWAEAQAGAAVLDGGQVSPITPGIAGILLALRIELLRGLDLPQEGWLLAGRLTSAVPAELSAWAQAGLDADAGHPDLALRRLADACDAGARGVDRAALPLVLHRIAEISFAAGETEVTAAAAAALGRLDRAAPLTAILAGLARAYATGDPRPARRAGQLADGEGAMALAAEALTVRGRIGDAPATTQAAAHAAWWRLGAVGKARAVAALLRAAGLAVPEPERRPAPAAPAREPAPLTRRERSLVRLVHEGRTNQQIARCMNISVKTVEAYLTRVYRKTACASRVELAVAVTERRVRVD